MSTRRMRSTGPWSGVAGIETSTVGRGAELAQLQAVFQAIQRGPHVATIVAETGIGKSRLLLDFANWLERQPQPIELMRVHPSVDRATPPYVLIRSLFAARFGIGPDDSAALERQKLEEGLISILGPEHTEPIPFIGYLIGFDYSASPSLHGVLHDARQIRDRAFHAITQVFTHLLQERPLAILIEGLQWTDHASLDFIEHLVSQSEDLPLLVVALASPELYEWRPAWGKNEHRYTRLDLQPLSEADILRLLDEILQKAPDFPPEIRTLIASRAVGSPLYIEEVIRMMIDDGLIVVGEEWQVDADRLRDIRVPTSLADVMLARLQGLSSQEQRVMQRAAVVGHVFWDGALLALHHEAETGPEIGEAFLQDILRNLEDRNLIVRHSGSAFSGTAEYAVQHTTLRDVLCEMLPDEARSTYHAQVAGWLAGQDEGEASDFAGRIAEHYEGARDMDTAARWYAQAGSQAKATYAPETAASYLRRALDLWAQHPTLPSAASDLHVKVWGELGDVLNWLGRFSEAAAAFQQMHALAHLCDAAAEARALRGIASAHMYQGDVPAALNHAQHGNQAARRTGADAELVRILQLEGLAHFRLGNAQRALELGEEAVALARAISHPTETANSLNFLGGIHFMLGQYDSAATHLAEALDMFQALGSRDKATDLLNNLGVIAEARGNYDAALAHYRHAASSAGQIGKRHKEAMYLGNVGGVRVKLRDFAAAEADLLTAIQMAEHAGIGRLSEPYRLLAEAYLGEGKAETALETALHALEVGQRFKALDNLAGVWRTLGMVAAHTLTPISVELEGASCELDAAACFERSAQIYDQLGMKGERAATLRAWARHELLHGDRERGAAMWQQARELYLELGAESEALRMSDLPDARTA